MPIARMLRCMAPWVLVATMSSCAAVHVRTTHCKYVPPPFFGGTLSNCLILLRSDDVSHADLMTPFAILDLPFSLALDCALIPCDILVWMAPEIFTTEKPEELPEWPTQCPPGKRH